MPGILRRTRAYLEFTLRPPGYFVDFLNFASDFAPDQLSDSGKLASFQNGAPNTLCFPWKFPETQSAVDPLFSFLFAGKACAGQEANGRSQPYLAVLYYRMASLHLEWRLARAHPAASQPQRPGGACRGWGWSHTGATLTRRARGVTQESPQHATFSAADGPP